MTDRARPSRVRVTAAPSLWAIVERSSVVVCCGTGGVGKTTTAAAIALRAAHQGRRVMVVTIDPARRLADAFGLSDGLSNEPQRIDIAQDRDRDRTGELWASMLDAEATFAALVHEHAAHAEQADRILASRFAKNVAGSLSGTHEYMAMEKLHALYASGHFDLIVLDTPPTHDALAFVDAPRLLTRLLDNRLYRVLVHPRRGVLRAATTAVQAVIRPLTRVVGAEVVDDAVAFFRAFEGMEEGFRDRAEDVLALLRADDTAFVVVATPRRDTVAETTAFVRQLAAADISVRAAIVNRCTPTFTPSARPAPPIAVDAAVPHTQALADFAQAAAAEGEELAVLVAAIGDAPVVRVPLLASDVHDLAGLSVVADRLDTR
jgi:anion-transporting  ArsA/GET3 family ATPase